VTCTFCGRSVAQSIEDEDGRRFCCPGCRDVSSALGSATSSARKREHEREHEHEHEPGACERDIEGKREDGEKESGEGAIEAGEYGTAFFRVDGMHCRTCEQFLEQVVTAQEGVGDAEASYVTETVRVEYDPERISTAQLREALSPVGYTATLRRGATHGSPAERRRTRRQSEPRRPEERSVDDLLGYQYAAGVVFGSFLLLPYVVVVYPAQFPSVFGPELADFFAGGVVDSGGVLLLPLFLGLAGVVVFFTGLPLLRGAYVSLKTRQPNTDLLVAVTVVSAYVYGGVALVLGRTDIYFDLTIVVAATVVAAIFYESLVKQRALGRLTDLTISQVDDARRYAGGETTTIPVGDLEPGETVLVRRGERVPVDGILQEGECTVDESVVTGESLPVSKVAGDDVVGGSVVTGGAAVVRVGDPPTSSVDRLRSAVWDLQSADHGLQRRADRLAARIVPFLFVIAGVVAAGALLTGDTLSTATLAFLGVLVVGCPWGLGLATPLSAATSIEAATERGLVVFDETVFERLRGTDVVVFDKTGTLTTGEMSVVEADAPEELLAAAGVLERRGAHPAAGAIAAEFGPDTDDIAIEDFRTHATGVEGNADGSDCLVGHPALFEEQGWTVDEEVRASVRDARESGRLPVVVGRDGRAEGTIVLGDEPREGWEETVSMLADRDVDVVILTGDEGEAAAAFERHPAVDDVFAGVPPEGKTETIERLQADRHVTMVGDGTNDAPALAAADLGVALGGGTALASDAADIAVADTDLATVGTAFGLAGAARRRLRQNTALALLYNAIAIPFAAFGLLNPVFVMLGAITSAGLVGLNSARGLVPASRPRKSSARH